VPVAWHVALGSGPNDVIASGTATAEPSRDHTVKVDVEGLEPATTYYYWFETSGVRSRVGRTRTLAEGSCDRARFAVCSCASYTAGYFNAYACIAARDDLDFVLHLGDYVYECATKPSSAERALDPPHECIALSDYRRRYAHYRSDPDLAALHARHPVIATIDDHEISDNAWRDGALNHDAGREGSWAQRKNAALQAWREWTPIRLPDPHRPERIFRSFALGDLADVYVLDERNYRDRQAKDRAEMQDSRRTVLGGAQRRWLTQGIARSSAAWRLVANTVMMGQVHAELMPNELAEPLSEAGLLSKSDLGPAADQWDGYPAERARLLRMLGASENVVILSGDVHTAWATELKLDAGDEWGRPAAVEFVTPSVTSENLDELAGVEPRRCAEIERAVAAFHPHVKWVDLHGHGYLQVDVTRDRVEGRWHFVDDLHRRSAVDRSVTGWEVSLGEARLRPASTASSPNSAWRAG
jgi:alkaline phosphatase D